MVGSRRDRAGRAPLGCIGTMLVFGVFIYAVSKVGMPWLKYQQFHDEMHADAQFAVNLPDSIIRSRITLRADSLRLPPEAKTSLVIRRNKAQRTILIQSRYTITVHFFLLGDKVFTFRPKVEEAI